ncbi:MAG: hypothetical protein OJF49_000259 [Ktedonobacterales bacterium]|nr:MAG: hypothetical protein OJF49_000259 [Ktedonobacterales bacterium]
MPCALWCAAALPGACCRTAFCAENSSTNNSVAGWRQAASRRLYLTYGFCCA